MGVHWELCHVGGTGVGFHVGWAVLLVPGVWFLSLYGLLVIFFGFGSQFYCSN